MPNTNRKLSFGFVCCAVRTTRHLLQLILYQVATQGREVVGEYHALDVVVLMLDDARGLSGKLLIVLHKVLVEVAHADGYGATHILVQAWE